MKSPTSGCDPGTGGLNSINGRVILTTPALEGRTDGPPPETAGPGFNEWLLGGVIVLTVFSILLAFLLYLLPGEYLQIPELQPTLRVAAEADFKPGESRLVTWGAEPILVVRSEASEYHALEGRSSLDGCLLRWDPPSLRVVSPCNYLVYDLHGNVVRGLTTVPLRRYTVFVRQGTVYVTGR